MAIATSTYFGLTKVRDMSPNAADWATSDSNFETIGLVMKALEQHHHTGTAAVQFPGYDADPTKITLPVLTSSSSGGVMSPGTTIGVKLSYTDGSGLETAASPEQDITLPSSIDPPNAPTLNTITGASNALGGGVYVYVLTKTNGSGETTVSQVLIVQIPYDQTYSATLNFDAISTYTDGTTGLNLYRAAGQNSAFQLITSISGSSTTTFTDTNTIAPGNQNVQPPISSTFNANYKVHIDWSAQTIPANASFINVFVTQQAGIWGSNCLLSQLAITGGSPPTSINYLGSESLASESPKYGSSAISGPPKVNLGTEATGAPVLTADQDFAKFQAKSLRLENSGGVPTGWGTPQNGAIYYDSSTKNIRAYINGTWTNWGTSSTSTYTHPAQESGGHIAANIPHSGSSGVALKTILDRIADSTTAAVKQVSKVQQVLGSTTSAVPYTSTTPGNVTDLEINFTPAFNNQWVEVNGWFVVQGGQQGQTIAYTYAYEVFTGGSPTYGTPRVIQVAQTGYQATLEVDDLVQLPTGTWTVSLVWWISGDSAQLVSTYRQLTVMGVY